MPGVNHHTLVDVAERQVTQHAGLRVGGHDGQNGLEVADDVAMRQLYPLHRAGSTGGIDDGGDIIGSDTVAYLVEILHTRIGNA